MDDGRDDKTNCKGVWKMKEVIKFLGFIAYLILLFWIEDVFLLVGLFFLNVVGFVILKIEIKNFLKHMRILLPFVLFTMLLNSIFSGLHVGALIGFRLILAYHMTYLFSKKMTSTQIASTIKKLIVPLKIFHINPENIEIMIRISFCVMPILKSEIEQKQYALKAKGAQIKLKYMLLIIKPLFISILRRTKEMEKSLIAKAYEE